MCEECGAPGSSCEARYHELLAREFEDSRFGAVHHLTVAAYMLQHSSRLTREGWLYERQLLRDFLIARKLPALIRSQNRDLVDDGRRVFKIKSRDGRPVVPQMKWTHTILDVCTESAEQYQADVTTWATAALQDSETIAL